MTRTALDATSPDAALTGFEGRTALVVAGARGIGAAVVEHLARRGAAVVVVDVDGDAGSRLADQLAGLRVTALAGDAADDDALAAAFDEAIGRHGRVDIVHANAGIGTTREAADLGVAEWQRVIDVNLTGSFLAARRALQHMRSRPGGGAIVFTSSPHALATARACSPYAASKAGLLGLVRALALEGARHGVRVNAVIPGAIDTPMVRDFCAAQPDPVAARRRFERIHALDRLGTPEEVAAAVGFLCSDAASFVTGTSLAVDGGLLATLHGDVGYDEEDRS